MCTWNYISLVCDFIKGSIFSIASEIALSGRAAFSNGILTLILDGFTSGFGLIFEMGQGS